MDESEIRREFGPMQTLFRYPYGVENPPSWVIDHPSVERDFASGQWMRLVAHVANTANESGFFEPKALDWRLQSDLTRDGALAMVTRLEAAGALVRHSGHLYIDHWRSLYRLPIE